MMYNNVEKNCKDALQDAVALVEPVGHSQAYYDALWAKYALTSSQKRRHEREQRQEHTK